MSAKFLDKTTLWVFFLLATINLYLVWGFEFATQDGPAHMQIGANIFNLIKGHCTNINELFTWTPAPVPTWISYFIIIPSLQFFSPEVVEKIMFSGTFLFFCFSSLCLLRTINNASAFFIIPLILLNANYITYMGSYNSLIGTSVYFLTLRWWLTSGRELGKASTIKISAILLLLYFCHILSLAIFVLSIAAIEIRQLLIGKDLLQFIKRSLRYLLASLPIMVCFYLYMHNPKMAIEGYIPWSIKLANLLVIDNLYTLSQNDIALVFISSFLIWFLVIYIYLQRKTDESGYAKQLIAIVTSLALAMALAPASFGGGWLVEPRIQAIFFLLIIFCCACYNFTNKERSVIIAITLGLNLFCLWNKYEALKDYHILETYAEAGHIVKDHSNILSVELSPFTVNYKTGEENLRSQIPNVTGFLTAGKTCVADVSAHAFAEKNIFPISYKDKFNPYYTLGKFRTASGLKITLPIIDLEKYKATGVKIDYVILRGSAGNMYKYNNSTGLNTDELYKNFMQQLNSHFKETYQSADKLLTIYEPI